MKSKNKNVFVHINEKNKNYKDEEAILTKVSSVVDFSNSKIEYTLTATSNALSMTSVVHNFPAVFGKPSDEIKRLLKDQNLRLTEIFYGMKNIDEGKLSSLISGDDKAVEIKAKDNITVLNDYTASIDGGVKLRNWIEKQTVVELI